MLYADRLPCAVESETLYKALSSLPERQRGEWHGCKQPMWNRNKEKIHSEAVGGIGNLLDEKCRDKDLLALIKYTADEDKDEKILENQKVLKTPVVRNRKQATAGYQPNIWKKWM